MVVSMISSSIVSRACRTAAMFILVLFAASQAQAEPKIDKETCEQLKLEQAKFAASGIAADFERGPEWAKTNLSPDRLREIEHYIILEEQLKFGCRMAEVSLDAARAAEEANELEGITPAKDKKAAKKKREDKKSEVTKPAAGQVEDSKAEDKKPEDKTPGDTNAEDSKTAKQDKGAAAAPRIVPQSPKVQPSATPPAKIGIAKTEAAEAGEPYAVSPEPAAAPVPVRRSTTDHMNRAFSNKAAIPGNAKTPEVQWQLSDE